MVYCIGDPFTIHNCTLCWTFIYVRRKHLLLLFIYKALLKILPNYLCSSFTWRCATYLTVFRCRWTWRLEGLLSDILILLYGIIYRRLRFRNLVSLNSFIDLIKTLLNLVCTCFVHDSPK